MTSVQPNPSEPAWPPLLAGAAGLFVLVLISDAVSLLLSRHSGSMPSIWVANGLAAGVLVSMPRRHWSMLLGVIAAALLAGHSIAYGSWWSLHLLLVPVDLLEILLVSLIVHHYFPVLSGEQGGYQRLGTIATLAALVACLVSTLLAAVIQYIGADNAFVGTASDWLRAHLLGMVIMGMLTVVTFRERGRLLGPRGQRLALARDVVLLLAISTAVFAQTSYPLSFILFAPLLYLIFRYRFPGLVLGVTLLALVTNIATSLGLGPFALTVNEDQRTLVAQAFLAVSCLVALPVALVLADRQRLANRVAKSEALYRLLADYSTDLIVRIASDNTRRYVSPSVKDMLDWSPEEFIARGAQLIHPEDRHLVDEVLATLRDTGRPRLIRYRLQHRGGGYLWIEAIGKLAPSPDHPGELETIYTARDVTERVLAEQALADSEKRLRTITDNVPAIIAQVASDERYIFINAFASQLFGVEASSHIGRTVQETRSPAVYALIKPHIELALKGESSTFEYEAAGPDAPRYFQATYVPASAADGTSSGFYMLTTEITRIKLAEQQLDFLAHHDALTGIANRLTFRESITAAVEHAALTHEPLLLMMIDVDHFKQINDTYGHAAGDAALSEVALRLKTNIRKTDRLARLGGDEFVVLCHDIGDAVTAAQLAQKITDAMQSPMTIGAHTLNVSLSIGVALYRDAPSVDALTQFADEMLYQAKAAGRACFRLASRGMD